MNSIITSLQYWLVNHPSILNFSWIPGQTLGSSPLFLSLTIFSYLSLTLLLPLLRLPPLKPHILRSLSVVHNLVLLLLSFTMALGCILTIVSHTPHLHWIICFPPKTSPSGPLFFWAYVFYLSKVLELVDTLLIIVGNSIRRLTFLHVYHHATVLIMCYLWLQTSQSLFPVALVTNTCVHVIMYGYYMLSSLGVRPKWKRVVTDCQIVQFLFSFAVSGLMLYYHFGGSGCSGSRVGASMRYSMPLFWLSLLTFMQRVTPIATRRNHLTSINGLDDDSSTANTIVFLCYLSFQSTLFNLVLGVRPKKRFWLK